MMPVNGFFGSFLPPLFRFRFRFRFRFLERRFRFLFLLRFDPPDRPELPDRLRPLELLDMKMVVVEQDPVP